jgi:cell division protein FtsN
MPIDAQASSPAPDSAAALAGASGAEAPLYVQVSTSQNEAWSSQMAQQLSRAGLAARVLPPTGLDDGFRVVLGPYESRDEAEAIGRKLGRPFFIYQPSP